MNLPDTAVDAGRDGIVRQWNPRHTVGYQSAVLARAVLEAASREITCPRCNGRALKFVRGDESSPPCSLCSDSGVLFVLIQEGRTS